MATPDPEPPAEESPEGPAGRGLRRLGLLLLLLAAVLPYHGYIEHPGEFAVRPTGAQNWLRGSEAYRPLGEIEFRLRRALPGGEGLRRSGLLLFPGRWKSGDPGWLVFLAVPPWLLALGLAGDPGSRSRLAAGLVLWAASACLPLTIAAAWRSGDRGLGPRGLREVQAAGAGIASAVVLVARPPGRRRPEDLEATLSTHAAVALGLVVASPAVDAAVWILEEGESPGTVLLALLHNYRPGFHLTAAALGLVAAPLYFSGDALRRLYDRTRPWRSRSSTPTPTSTSTGSTGTGSRSSSGPAPPGSSPS